MAPQTNAEAEQHGVLPPNMTSMLPRRCSAIAQEHDTKCASQGDGWSQRTEERHFAPGEGEIEEIEEEFQDDDFDGIGAAEYAEDEFSDRRARRRDAGRFAREGRRHQRRSRRQRKTSWRDFEPCSRAVPAERRLRAGVRFLRRREEDEAETTAERAEPHRAATQRSRARAPHEGADPLRRDACRVQHGRKNTQRASLPTISELLKEGQQVLVQIAKEPMAKKGARITSHIALPGRFLVFMPTVGHVGVSRKIGSDEERLRLKRILLSEKGDAHGGFIVRTAAAGSERRRPARRYPFPDQSLAGDQVALGERQASGADLPRPQPGGARTARSGDRQLLQHLDRFRSGV